jgi:hypothetical protein
MAIATALREPAPAVRAPAWWKELALALLIAALVFAYHAATGFQRLTDPGGDNDSLLRLVQVRDLLTGQGWFDLHQYRMGLEGGFVMHWSRLVDAPIAAIILSASWLSAGPALAEKAAQVLWPMLLFGLALFLIMRMARLIGGEWAVFPAAALGTAALYFVGAFGPGALDHHNVQIVATLALTALLMEAPERPSASLLAGLCAALMLAIGMETAPYVAVAGAWVSVVFLSRGSVESRRAAGFGIGFAGTALAAFLATVGPADWTTPRCDSLSNVQLSLAALGGFGLAGIALLPASNSTFARRLISLGVLGFAFIAVAKLAFPQCLDDPYAGLDTRLRENWLDGVAEAQSFLALARHDWAEILIYYVTPLLALFVHSSAMIRSGLSRKLIVYALVLAAAILVGFWQVRGTLFAIPLATVALAAWVARWREPAAHRAGLSYTARMVAAWLVSCNLLWGITGNLLREGTTAHADTKPKLPECTANAGFARLAKLPKGTVLAVTDLGSPILANTPHRVLSGPYHRNGAGNLLMIDMMMGEPAKAEALARRYHVDHVAICRGNPETSQFAGRAPDGLMSQLVKRTPPAWLEKLPETDGEPIEIYRVLGQL